MASAGSAAGSAAGQASGSRAGSSADRRVAAIGTQLRASAEATGDPLKSLSATIADMKTEQARLREERKRHAAELKNAQRRKRRLRSKARQLSNEDLLAVLLLRQEQTAETCADGGDASSGSGSGGAAPATPAEGDH